MIDLYGVAAVVASIGGATAAVISAFNGRDVRRVHREIQTGNGKTLGQAVKETNETVNGKDEHE